MRPPLCSVCDRAQDKYPQLRFDVVKFADYRPLPDGRVGHPEGLEWFCGDHLDAAMAVRHLNSANALQQLRVRAS